jgi:hypothetical protein
MGKSANLKAGFLAVPLALVVLALIFPAPCWSFYPNPQPKADADQFVETVNADNVARRLSYDAAKAEMINRKVLKRYGHQVWDESVVESGRTILLIMVITGVAIVKNEIERANREGRNLNFQETGEICLYVMTQLLNQGDIWFNMVGAGEMSLVMGKPLKLFTALLANAAAKNILIALLASAVHSTIIFIGWEIGGQLWNEARMLLKSDRDYKLSEGMLTTVLLASVSPDRRRIFTEIIRNEIKILLVDDKLRSDLFYNAWRLRIMTGDFVTLVLAMAGAMTVGGAIIGGPPGAILGFIFGAVGGVGTLFLPQTFKDSITRGMRAGQVESEKGLLREDYGRLLAITDDGLAGDVMRSISDWKVHVARALMPTAHVISGLFPTNGMSVPGSTFFTPFLPKETRDQMYQSDAEQFGISLPKVLEARRKVRERIMTVHFENYYLLKLRIQEATHVMSTATETIAREEKDPKKQKHVKSLLDQIVKQTKLVGNCLGGLEKIEQNLRKLYRDEDAEFQKLIDRGEKIRNQDETIAILEEEREKLDVLARYIDQFVFGYNGHTYAAELAKSSQYKKDPAKYIRLREHKSKNLMTKFHFRGFDEAHILSAWQTATN